MRKIFVILFALLLPMSARANNCQNDTYKYSPEIYHDWYGYDLANKTWDLTSGVVSGIAVCNSTEGTWATPTDTDFPTGTTGNHCWCKMTDPLDSLWIYVYGFNSLSDCDNTCAFTCGNSMSNNEVFSEAMLSTVQCQSCTNAPANAHYTGAGTTATNCPWECDAGYYGSSANGDTSCTACGSGYFCTGGTNRELCTSVINYAGTTPDATATYSGFTDPEHATSSTACVCDFYFHDESRRIYQYEGRCYDGPTGYQYTRYYWCNTGYYASNPLWFNDWYSACTACTNKPANSHYTSYSTPSAMYAVESNCPWECDAGYGLTSSNTCEQLCTAGITELHTGTGLIFNIYTNKNTSPAIHIKPDGSDTVCYVNLSTGAGTNAVNIQYNGTVYHTTN